jgi:hypothetical protein
MQRLIALLAGTLLLSAGLVACGDDGGDTLTAEEFCEHLAEIEDMDDGDLLLEEDLDAALDALDELVAVAPDEVRDDLRIMRDKFAEFGELDIDEDDPEAGFEALMMVVFDPEFLGAAERLEEFSVEECGFEPSDDVGDFDDVFDDDAPAPEAGDDPVPEAAMPDDVSLTRQPATLITWDENDDAFNYRVEAGGQTLGTAFGGRYIALGDVDDVAVEALEIGSESLGPAQGVQSEPVEALVVEWTEEPGGTYYVWAQTTHDGEFFELTDSPYVFEVPADEVEAVRFGPGVQIADDDGPRTDAPFDHGEDYYVELPLP